jgi:hypothetical protein
MVRKHSFPVISVPFFRPSVWLIRDSISTIPPGLPAVPHPPKHPQAKIGSISIPDLPFDQDGFEGAVTNIKCQSFVIASADIALTPPNALGVSMSGITVACNAGWNFKLKSWPHFPDGSGTVDIAVSSTSAGLNVAINTASLHPQLAVNSVSLDVGNIDLSFHGSLLDWILDLFKGMIESAVKSNLQGVFSNAVSDFVTSDLNGVLANLDLDIPISAPAPYNISEARFGLVATPAATSTYIGVALQGDVVPIANPVTPPIAPPALPPFSTNDGNYYISALISPYTIVSAAYTFFTAGDLTWTVSPASIPLGFNTTSAYLLVAPGFPIAYPNAAVSLGVSITGVPSVTMSPSGVAGELPVSLSFMALAPNGTYVTGFVLGANTSVSLSLDIAPGPSGSPVITGSLSYLDASIGLVSSSVGSVNVGLLQALVNVTFSDVILPLLDTLLAHGLPLPSAPGLTLTNATLGTGTGYASFSADFTFDPTDVPEFARYFIARRQDKAVQTDLVEEVAPKKTLLRASSKKQQA